MPRLVAPLTVLLSSLALFGLGCSREPSSRTAQQLAELQKKKAAEAAAKKEDKLAPLAVEVVNLDPPYGDEGAERITPDGPCPDGFWALFPTEAPGATPEEKKANEARRPALVDSFKAKKFLVKLRIGSGVTLKPYDAPNGSFTIEVQGTVDCTDARGHVALAWSDTKTESPGEPGAIARSYWVAKPVTFTLPVKTLAEAKAFETENRLAISARVVFTAGKVEVDKKMKKVEKFTDKRPGEETIEYGGGLEDWGAGRLLHGELVGIRVAVDRERKQLLELKGKSP